LGKILIVGWYGTETLGDKAILYSIIQQLNSGGISSERIVVASIEPYVTRNTLDEFLPVSFCDVISLAQAEQFAREGRFAQVIFGGGPIMSSIDYLCPIASIFSSVKRQGGQSIVWGCGLGPIRTKKRDLLNKLAIKRILRLADYCIFRDSKSHKLALSLGASAKPGRASTALDPAFHWVQSIYNSDWAVSPESAAPSSVGFAIRELPISEYFSDYGGDPNDLRAAFDQSIVGLIDQYASLSPVHLQCMHRLPCGGDDRIFYCDLLGEKAFDYGLTFAHSNPVDDVATLSTLQSLYAMRFHSVVFAVALGVPVVPIDYTNGGKISAFCELLGIRCWSPAELIHQLKSDSLPLEAQMPDRSHLDKIVKESLHAYSELAHKIALFDQKL
jgi:polysaccharide pyruvyl transferase WcaK-like protein